MDIFQFKCVTIAKTEMKNGIFIKAINAKGPIELFSYGKKLNIDNMNLIDVSGFYRSASKNYLTIKRVDILNRFSDIRESFYKLSAALLMMKISYRTKIGMEILVEGLQMLDERPSYKQSLLWFLLSFLIQNGIFNEEEYTKWELAIIKFILKSKNKAKLKIDDEGFKSLNQKLMKQIESYAGTTFRMQTLEAEK